MPWIGRLARGGGVSRPCTTDNILCFKSVSRPGGLTVPCPLLAGRTLLRVPRSHSGGICVVHVTPALLSWGST